MGAQDSLAFAEEFKASGGIESFLLIWDESFETWQYYGVRGQPTAVLVEPNGEPIIGWSGFFDQEEVLRLASEF